MVQLTMVKYLQFLLPNRERKKITLSEEPVVAEAVAAGQDLAAIATKNYYYLEKAGNCFRLFF
jgi:hypothetical protein